MLLLACAQCGASHPHFQFRGDTDMATDGLLSAGDREGKSLALFTQVQAGPRPQSGDKDTRSASLIGVARQGPPAVGQDFQTFLKNHKPAEVTFRCHWCDAEEMTVLQEMEPDAFEAAGGIITCTGEIELRKGPAVS